MSRLFKKIIVCISAVCGVCVCALDGANAQGVSQIRTRKHSLSVDWGAAIPVGQNFIDKASAANVSLEWDYRIIPMLSAGVSVGYIGFTDKGIADEYFDSTLSSGYRDKRLQTIPIMVQLDLFPIGGRATLFRPYLGVGVGGQYARFRITGETIVTSERSNWAERFSARVGTRIFPVKNGGLFFDARVTWGYGGNDWPMAAGLRSMQSIGVTAGVGGVF